MISSQAYEVYADIGEADLYLAASTHPVAWPTASAEDKSKALVTATRILDRQKWLGEKYLTTGQALAWPRSGTGVDGVEDDVVPQNIIDASIEMASALLDGSDLQTEQNQSQKLQSITAGSVNLTYFRGAEGTPLRFPLIVDELIRDYLAGSFVSFGTLAAGVDGVSVTGQDLGLSSPL